MLCGIFKQASVEGAVAEEVVGRLVPRFDLCFPSYLVFCLVRFEVCLSSAALGVMERKRFKLRKKNKIESNRKHYETIVRRENESGLDQK